ncbi:uncharacterized protein J3D65DRAFT_606057 [Phyllosticta citribraziliensis]|uniref:Uncharacterized protein n=1 Tax=Phyllosticta citribraziliensis TaxID=989973 RepID=A0ABR1LA21_9PEZI
MPPPPRRLCVFLLLHPPTIFSPIHPHPPTHIHPTQNRKMATIVPIPQTIGFTGGGSGGGGDPPRRPNRKRPREHEIDNELYAKRLKEIYTKEYMKIKCCCCMKQKHGTWETCDRTCYWCGRKHVGERCISRGRNFYKKHGGQWQSDIRSRQADFEAYDHAPAPQNQRSAGGDVTRYDMERRSNVPRDDARSWLHGSHAGNADFAHQYSQDRYDRYNRSPPRPETNEQTARTETDELWRSIRDLRQEWQQRFEQQQQQIAGLEQSLSNLQAGVQQYIYVPDQRQRQQQGEEEEEEEEHSNAEP